MRLDVKVSRVWLEAEEVAVAVVVGRGFGGFAIRDGQKYYKRIGEPLKPSRKQQEAGFINESVLLQERWLTRFCLFLCAETVIC